MTTSSPLELFKGRREVLTAKAPDGVNEEEKYDVTVGSMIAVLRYGSGFPMHRLEKMQASLGIPLPASVQWEIVCAELVGGELQKMR